MVRRQLCAFLEIAKSIHFFVILIVIGLLVVNYYVWEEYSPWFWHILVFEFKYDIIGSLLFIPLLYASIAFWWRGTLLVWLLSLCVILPAWLKYIPNTGSFLSNIAFAVLPLALVLTIAGELNWRDRQKSAVADRERERRMYMAKIFEAQEDERRRIAQELHDGTTQELIAIANGAQTALLASQEVGKEQMNRHVEGIRDAILEVSEEVRRMSLDLRPALLDHVGLLSAIRWLAERSNMEAGMDIAVVVTGDDRKLNSEIEVRIFRTVQEALSNVRRHSHATQVLIQLDYAQDGIRLTIEDNGVGLVPGASTEGLAHAGKLGLIGMQERIEVLGGMFDVRSAEEGTTLSIEIPLTHCSEPHQEMVEQ